MTTRIEEICREFFESVAEQFPIVAASDEFYYFPQVKSRDKDWSRWDNFSVDAIDGFAAGLSGYERELAGLRTKSRDRPGENLDEQIDFSFLLGTIRTLREQLTEVRHWEQQPTFWLTIACLGIAEALESGDSSAAELRAQTLPDFIQTAKNSLQDMPVLFRDLGLGMLTDTQRFFLSLIPRLPSLKKTMAELESLGTFLRTAGTRPDFRMPSELTQRVVRRHLNCCLDISEIQAVLDREIADMNAKLAQEARSMADSLPWEAQMENILLPSVPEGGLVALYREQVRKLAAHCMAMGILTEDMYRRCPVQVLPVPSFLSATRTASSYSVYPDHPPAGGIFYVINAEDPAEAHKTYQREYKILSAHETYPGHHFLDCNRLYHERHLRRCIEKPLFYEGWACFAEELMQTSGYFTRAAERMLLARRRLWRAVRGKVDLGLQTGVMTLENAAGYLVETGISSGNAAGVVRKYTLNPGYQLCYTLGFKKFSALYTEYGRQDLKGFVERAVSQGEIDFVDLERILRRGP